MNRALFLLLALAATANAQLLLVPDNRVSVRTNNMAYLTNTVLQGDMAIIDTNLFKLYAADVTLSNRITNVSNLVVGASNRADEAYTLALAATNISPNQQTYVYTVSNDVTMVAGTAGQTTFTVTTQDLARIHVGHYLGPTNFFSGAATQLLVSAVDRTSGSNLVTITGGGSLSTTTNNVTITVTNAGSFTHTVPNGYSRCRVIVTGSGGTGAIDSDNNASGGGAGGTAIGYFRFITGASFDVTVGKRPAKAIGATADGNDGNSSSFSSLLTAYGGGKGHHNGSVPTSGGLAYGGALNLVGGGSGAALSSALGGSSYWGGGNSGAGIPAAYGSGGLGVSDTGSYDSLRSEAGDGVVVIEYY